jgi:hypothetical protein
VLSQRHRRRSPAAPEPESDGHRLALAQRLCVLCRDHAVVSGVSLAVRSADIQCTICATDRRSDRLEEMQVVMPEGPGVDGFRHGRAQLVSDLRELTDDTWPWFTPAALELGVRAMFVLPLQVGPVLLGTLTLHRTTPGALAPEQIGAARALAGVAAVLLTLHDREEGPGSVPWAVGDGSRFRAEVPQAVGVTMVLCDVDATDAFAVLCARAYASGRPMGEIAGEVVTRRLRLGPDAAV